MKIKALTLFTSKLQDQKLFYKNVLGFDLVENQENSFSVQTGSSKLTFNKSKTNHIYHYCFLIPSNKLNQSVDWLSKRTTLVPINKNQFIQKFENWNAASVYFYDGSGNLAEFIVRYDLKNNKKRGFDTTQILCINEIGMPSKDITKLNHQLEQHLQSKFWKGDFERFGTNGSQSGLFLLVNSCIKKTWFPTQLKTTSSPFEATILVGSNQYNISFKDGVFCKLD